LFIIAYLPRRNLSYLFTGFQLFCFFIIKSNQREVLTGMLLENLDNKTPVKHGAGTGIHMPPFFNYLSCSNASYISLVPAIFVGIASMKSACMKYFRAVYENRISYLSGRGVLHIGIIIYQIISGDRGSNTHPGYSHKGGTGSGSRSSGTYLCYANVWGAGNGRPGIG